MHQVSCGESSHRGQSGGGSCDQHGAAVDKVALSVVYDDLQSCC